MSFLCWYPYFALVALHFRWSHFCINPRLQQTNVCWNLGSTQEYIQRLKTQAWPWKIHSPCLAVVTNQVAASWRSLLIMTQCLIRLSPSIECAGCYYFVRCVSFQWWPLPSNHGDDILGADRTMSSDHDAAAAMDSDWFSRHAADIGWVRLSVLSILLAPHPHLILPIISDGIVTFTSIFCPDQLPNCSDCHLPCIFRINTRKF